MRNSESHLAPCATRSDESRGRAHEEPNGTFLGPFELDRQRVIGCTAFRRLQGKTQVFAPSFHDHFRTRLTHTLEVAQVARTLATAMRVNESLAEVISLAHDLGHPPFGHAGEAALGEVMRDGGGFNHNAHSVRVVTHLEHPFPAFRGLNLTRETLAGLGAHRTQYDEPAGADATGVRNGGASVEAQIASVADRVAYDMHDLEDAIGAGFVSLEDLADTTLWRNAFEGVEKEHRAKNIHALRRTVIDSMVDSVLCDVVDTSSRRLRTAKSTESVTASSTDLVGMSDSCNADLLELETLLQARVYRRQEIVESDAQAKTKVLALFEHFRAAPATLPDRFARRMDDEGTDQVICDYIAGMTDRFCTAEYEKHVNA